MDQWHVVVPVKRLDRAKTRLLVHRADGSMIARGDLALAFAVDTVSAALAATRVASVLVVTDDPDAAEALAAIGASVAADSPDAGLNPALVHGASVIEQRHPGARIAALSADLPSLRASDLDAALEAAGSTEGAAFVSDVSGVGTTLYAATTFHRFAPAFGRRSRAAHRAVGARELDPANASRVRRDVDTVVDLWDAQRLGLGPRTASLLAGV